MKKQGNFCEGEKFLTARSLDLLLCVKILLYRGCRDSPADDLQYRINDAVSRHFRERLALDLECRDEFGIQVFEEPLIGGLRVNRGQVVIVWLE